MSVLLAKWKYPSRDPAGDPLEKSSSDDLLCEIAVPLDMRMISDNAISFNFMLLYLICVGATFLCKLNKRPVWMHIKRAWPFKSSSVF